MLLRYSDRQLFVDQKPWSATANRMTKPSKRDFKQDHQKQADDGNPAPASNRYLFLLLGVLVALPLIVFCVSFVFDRNVTRFLIQYPREGHVELVQRLLDNAY